MNKYEEGCVCKNGISIGYVSGPVFAIRFGEFIMKIRYSTIRNKIFIYNGSIGWIVGIEIIKKY